MKPTMTVARAIGAEFAQRALRPIMLGGLVVAAVLLCAGGWLTTQNAWWWLLEAAFIVGTILFVVSLMVVGVILRGVTPSLAHTQKQSVEAFVDKLERVAENIQTPKIIIVYYVVRDIIRPRPNSFIETVTQDSKTLAPDLISLRKQF